MNSRNPSLDRARSSGIGPSQMTRRNLIAQPVILREIVIGVDESVQLAADLGPSAMIGTFMLQNPGPFVAWMTLEKATDTSVYLPPPIEIAVGASPVFQIASQPAEEHQVTVVWDLSQFWLVGDNQFPGQHETILLAAFPLAV